MGDLYIVIGVVVLHYQVNNGGSIELAGQEMYQKTNNKL